TELAEVLSRIIKGARPQKKNKKGMAALSAFESAGGINITADEATNSLVIVASPSDYQNLVRVIKQLDKRRRQVFVEAMIVEASIDKLRELGTKWRVMGTHNGEPIGIGGFGTMDGSALQSLIYGLTGLTGGGMGNYFDIPMTTIDANGSLVESTLSVPGFAALFSMNEFRGAVNVLSTPQLLTSDNQEAEIIVGENVPFISKRERDITTANTVLSSIERKDVGITLRITPQITEGDYVKLDIYQEISSVKQDASDDILISVGPSTTKRSTQTSVVVKDNQTVVIGGLMEERDEENLAKVPVLGDIPVLGWLFKTKSISKKKTNLLIFITPHVIKDADSLGSITKSKQKEFAKVEKQYVEGEILVKFREGVTNDAAGEIIAGKGVSVIRIMKHVRVYLIKLGEGQDVEDAIREFSLIPEVEYAEPNYKMKAMRSKQR
ncbi:MAG: secretin N-terminal domain-containing protein, partial [Nitrospirota bacterium]|nr:secretin N-terminal domain-containing protein [Nitrospirota bacterium]